MELKRYTAFVVLCPCTRLNRTIMELKSPYPYEVYKAWAGLNRTIMELKRYTAFVVLCPCTRLNRTIMELKSPYPYEVYKAWAGLNRTIMELKLARGGAFHRLRILS